MKKKIIFGVVVLAAFIVAGLFIIENTKQGRKVGSKIGFHAPQCPANLEGILTKPLMDPQYISALTPLGNVSPPSHTSPVDHVYFHTNYDGKIPMYAPADATITQITSVSKEVSKGKYEVEHYDLRFEVCDGLILDFAGYNDVVDEIKKEVEPKGDKDCKRGFVKEGNGGIAEGQCFFNVNIPVKAGQQVGWEWLIPHPEHGGMALPFEIWAANYNVDPPKQTNWKYYNDERYAHIMCPFDLYAGELKKQFLAKMGAWVVPKAEKKIDGKDDKKVDPKLAVADLSAGHFVARNGEPLCGQVDQDIVGTIQGMWFSKPTPTDDDEAKFDGGLAFLHNNVDVAQGEISVGGDLTNGKSGVVNFAPTHSGTLDREPSEVKADGSVYCYDAYNVWGTTGKFLVQLVDDHHLKAEIQEGSCKASENFKKPFSYER